MLPINRYTIGSTLPLVAQHWIVLLKYNYKLLYIVLETILEMWWEWTAFSVLEIVHEYHWTGGVAILSMLFAHWCYFGGGFLALFVTKAKGDRRDYTLGGRLETVGNDINRFSTMAYKRQTTMVGGSAGANRPLTTEKSMKMALMDISDEEEDDDGGGDSGRSDIEQLVSKPAN